jgi:O-antigen ligase
MLAQLALLCLYARPFTQSWLNRVSWPLGLFALFLAQSKTSWISFPVCLGCMAWVRGDLRSWLRFTRPRQNVAAVAIPLVIILAMVGIGLAYIVGDLGFTIDAFFRQHETSFTSLTGRDRIWEVALEDWARHPMLGYGTNLFDEAYRRSVQIPFANDAHNQFIDTLARSGLVGAAGLGLYVTVLLALSLKYARASGGLSLAVFLAVIIRSVSQVPLGLFHYGPDPLQHFLLLAILAGRIGSGPLAAERYPVRQRSNQKHNTPRSGGRPELVGPFADNRRRRLTSATD